MYQYINLVSKITWIEANSTRDAIEVVLSGTSMAA